MTVRVRFPRGTQSLAIGDQQIDVVDGIAEIPSEHVAMLLNHRDDLDIVDENEQIDRSAWESAQEAESAKRAADDARRLSAERRAAVVLQASTEHYNASHSNVAVPLVNELVRDLSARTEGDGSAQGIGSEEEGEWEEEGEYEEGEENKPDVPPPPATKTAVQSGTKPVMTAQPAAQPKPAKA